MKQPPRPARLWQISVLVPVPAEKGIAALMEKVWGQYPTSYLRHETALARLTCFLEQKPVWTQAQKSVWAIGLRLLESCGIPVDIGPITIERVLSEDWAESWKKHFRPIRIGRELLIKPSWSHVRAGRHAAVVTLDPGLSFGTGQHPTTAFCLRQIVAAKTQQGASSLFDLGTGSGILAIAAAKLGYRVVEGIDFDAEAIRIARENARYNAVSIKLKHADVTRLPVRAVPRFDVICANLEFPLLISQTRKIVRQLHPQGLLVLAGILAREFDTVLKSYSQAGFSLMSEEKNAEWHSGAFRRR
jgi:ribosomal protein L11 methyltransferase